MTTRTTDPHICARCHQRGTGCCTLRPGTERLLFGLTCAECDAITAHTGEPEAFFAQRDTAPPGFVESLRQIHPAFARIMPGGRRIHLRVSPSGCYFLGEGGCRLPEAVRPYYCRLYPFWFTDGGKLMLLRSPTCLAQERALSLFEVMDRLGESETRLQSIFAAWLRAAESHTI